jgi:sigma-B regulation protein RsbU (phosphoserine phosphatase)
MHMPSTAADLHSVADLMRNLSLLTDPQQAAHLYGTGLRRFNMVPNDRYLSISRRDLPSPQFRITRNSAWTEHPDPWREKHKLPLRSGGILGEIAYSNEPAIIRDLPARLRPDDPAYEELKGFELLVALPHFDMGQSINYGILLNREASKFPFDQIPVMLWQANLWGRATLNLVNTQKLREAYEAIDHELKLVGNIQRSLLPRDLPKMPGAEVAAYYQTSQRAGGDYYDFFPLPGNQWGILLADVSGHGTPAAVLMAITHAIAHTHPGHPMPPEQLLTFVNRQLAQLYTAGNGTFVTAVYGIFDPATRRLSYASAGHPAPRLLRDQRMTCIETDAAFPLGVHGEERFESCTIQLQHDDHILFYTDGITDTFAPDGEGFGTDRLDAACIARPCASPRELVSHIIDELRQFSNDGPVTDDRTLLALRMT